MATAVLREIPQPMVKEYTLVLSEKEATALVSVLSTVGGSPSNSGRRHTRAILNALTGAGIQETFFISNCFEETACRVYWKDGEGL